MQVKPFAAKRPRIEMVPLIDMFFLLLAFFIFGVFSMTMREGVLVDLPAASTAEIAKDETVTVSVSPEGALFFGSRPVVLEELAAALRQAAQRAPQPVVLINGDRAAQHGVIVAVLDTVRQAGLSRVSLQTQPDE